MISSIQLSTNAGGVYIDICVTITRVPSHVIESFYRIRVDFIAYNTLNSDLVNVYCYFCVRVVLFALISLF